MGTLLRGLLLKKHARLNEWNGAHDTVGMKARHGGGNKIMQHAAVCLLGASQIGLNVFTQIRRAVIGFVSDT